MIRSSLYLNNNLITSCINDALDIANLDDGSCEVEEVGSGGSAVVFRISRIGHEPLALKIPAYGTRSSKEYWLLEKSLLKEAQALRSLNVDGIPKFFYIDACGRFLLREFVRGITLKRYIDELGQKREGRAELCRLVVALAARIFRVVHEHPAGSYVIRDFKPNNIIVEPQNFTLSLVDLGSIRQESNMLSSRSRIAYHLGSGKWLYWAPEQLLENAKRLNRRADYFSLGATIYFILTGEAPYPNDITNPFRAFRGYLNRYHYISAVLQEKAKLVGLEIEWAKIASQLLHPMAEMRPMNVDSMFGNNLGTLREVIPGVWRASEQTVAAAVASGNLPRLTTLICLRRKVPDVWNDWLSVEKRWRGFHFPIPPSTDPAFAKRMDLLLEEIVRIEKPVVLFCKEGYNRSGMAAAALIFLKTGLLEKAAEEYFTGAGDRIRGREWAWIYRWCNKIMLNKSTQ